MPTIAVTGSTGALGSRVIDSLSQRVPAASVVAIARSADRAAPLRAKGVEVRLASYDDPAALATAMQGVDRLLLVSGSEVGKRAQQHRAVVDAAKAAGVTYVVYTSLLHATDTDNPIAPEHVVTEKYIEASGLAYSFLRNGWYHENYLDTLAQVAQSGVLVTSAGAGRVSSAARAEYAEAAAIVIAEDGHPGAVYELAGDDAWTQEELAADLAAVIGAPVTLKNVTAQEHDAALEAAGVPAGARAFVLALDAAIGRGALEEHGGDLARLLGRRTSPLLQVLQAG